MSERSVRNIEHTKERSAELYEDLILHFARFCWVHQTEKAPSGKLWRDVFTEKSGLTLYQYKELQDAKRDRDSGND